MAAVLVKLCDYVYDSTVLPVYVQFSGKRSFDYVLETLSEYFTYANRDQALVGLGTPPTVINPTEFGYVDLTRAGYKIELKGGLCVLTPLSTGAHLALENMKRLVLSPVTMGGTRSFIRSFWVKNLEMMTEDEGSLNLMQVSNIEKLFN